MMPARRRISSGFCFALAGVGVGAVLLLLAGLALFGGPGDVAAQSVSVIDYDIDNDNLIDIRTLAQLDAIRHDLDGDGAPVLGLPAVAYNAAFPNRDGIVPGLMGCPGTCSGYELLNDLDFDTNGDGSVTSADGHAYTNWEPIGGYNVAFDGKGHTISHLTINRPGNNDVALFANMGSSGSVTSLGLPDANVTGGARAAILIGNSAATVYASWSSGRVSGSSSAAGLVGGTTASIIASYSTAAVTTRGGSSDNNFHGASGLVGVINTSSIVDSSYATGAITGLRRAGLVLGQWDSNKRITNSYWNTETSGTTSDLLNSRDPGLGATGRTTAQLQMPTDYTGIYANWNVDVDNADTDDNVTTGGDNPWHFGTAA